LGLSSLRSVVCDDTAPTAVYTLSLHDALPISRSAARLRFTHHPPHASRRGRRQQLSLREPRGIPGHARKRRLPGVGGGVRQSLRDRKSTRLNSSHVKISYAVFCLKKKKQQDNR